MMQRTIKWILLLAITSIIDHSFSAVFFSFEQRDSEEDYKNSRSASVHRGLLLSYSLSEKIQICRDLFSPYFDESTVISDGLENDDEPQHSLVIETINSFMPDLSLLNKIKDIFFKCSGKNLIPKYAHEMEYFVSSAFQPGLMYGGYEVSTMEDELEIVLKHYIGVSPEDESLEQMELEKQYVTIRRTIRALRDESPEYVQMIEERDNISELSIWQKFLLCSSINLSPSHEKDRRKFPLHWVKYKRSTEKNIHLYRRKCLTFTNDKYQEENWCTDCLYCKSSATEVGTNSINVLLTRAYSDKYSLYVLMEQNERISLKEHIKNVPILINAHVPLTDDARFVHPQDEE